MDTAARIASAPNDPLFAMLSYLVVIVGLVTVLATARSQRERTLRLLYFYVAYGTFEAGIKRLTHFAWYVYPLKFALFFIVLCSWWIGRGEVKARQTRRPMALALWLYLAIAALQIFNPNQSTPIVGVLGWMTDFMYATLFIVAFEVIEDEPAVRRLLWLTAALGVVSAVTCVLEAWSGAEQWQRLYPTFVPLQVYTETGDVLYRPTSLVPYIEVLGIAAMVGLLAQKGLWRMWLMAGIALCVISTLFHAIRITWIVSVLFLSLFVVLGRRKNWTAAAAVIVCAVAAIQVLDLGNSLIGNQLNSMTTPLDTFRSTRLNGVLGLSEVVGRYPLGLGVGETSPGLRFLDTGPRVNRLGTHNYLTDLAGQMSILGPLLLMVFGAGIAYRGVRALWRPPSSDAHAVMLKTVTALFCALLISLFGGGALVAYPLTEYFWITAGIIASLTVSHANVRRMQPARVIGEPKLFRRRTLRIVGRRARAQA